MTQTHTNKLPVGSIIHGSHRIEDLLPAFLFALEEVDGVAAGHFNSELIELGFGYSQCGVCFGPREEWPDVDEDTLLDIQAEITDKLGEYAPDMCYFGAYDGDGSDFGFWPSWDAISEAEHDGDLLRVSDLAEADEFTGDYVLLVNDHGNTYLYCGENELWSFV